MELSIVIPAHNEAERLAPTLRRYREHCPDRGMRFLVALDGCTDGTAEVARQQAEADPRVEVLDFPKLGKGGVIAEAFRRSAGELVGFVDADCATHPAEFLRLAAATRRVDGAIASRRHPSAVLPVPRAASRRVASVGFAALTRGLFRLPYADTQCGAKVFRRAALEQLVPLLSTRGFLFDVDLLARARDLGLEIAEIPTVWIDQDGSSVDLRQELWRMSLAAVALWLEHHSDPSPALADRPTAPAPIGDQRVVDVRDVADDPPAEAVHAERDGRRVVA
jgi:glycosyltransferase involved in cell wall biosynthesis